MQRSFILHASELSNLITVFKKLKSEPGDSQELIAKGEKVLDYIQEHFELAPGEPQHKNLTMDNHQRPETYPNTKLTEEEEIIYGKMAGKPIGHYKVPSGDSKPDPCKINEEEFDSVSSELYESMLRLSSEGGNYQPVLEELVEYLKFNTSLQEQNNFIKELTKAIICFRGKEIEKARIDFRRLEEEMKVLEDSIAKLKEQ